MKIKMFFERSFETAQLHFYAIGIDEGNGPIAKYNLFIEHNNVVRGDPIKEGEILKPAFTISEYHTNCQGIFDGLKESLARIGEIHLEDRHKLALDESHNHNNSLKEQIKFLKEVSDIKGQEPFYKKELEKYAFGASQKIIYLQGIINKYVARYGDSVMLEQEQEENDQSNSRSS